MKRPITNEVIAFPGRTAASERFSARDRIAIANLPTRLAGAGVTRVALHTQADHGDSQFGDFLMIYASGESWSRWGIGCSGRGFMVWRASDGESLGYFDGLGTAVDALEQEARNSLGPVTADAAGPGGARHQGAVPGRGGLDEAGPNVLPERPDAPDVGGGPPARRGMASPA